MRDLASFGSIRYLGVDPGEGERVGPPGTARPRPKLTVEAELTTRVSERQPKPGTREGPVRNRRWFFLFTVAGTSRSSLLPPRHASARTAGISVPERGLLTIDEGHKLRLALRLAGVTQARAAEVLNARQTQLSAWMALGKGPDDVQERLEAAFGFQTEALVDRCSRRAGNVLCHGYKALGSGFCAACSMLVPGPEPVNGHATEREPSCVSCGKSEVDQVRLRPARMLSGGGRIPIGAAVAGGPVLICTHCRNAHRHQLHRCPGCDGWMRAGRDR